MILNKPRAPGTFNEVDVFGYLTAVLHSPTYRSRYAEFLRYDFPCIPLPPDGPTFLSLADLGRELAKLQTMESVPPSPARFCGEGDNRVARIVYRDGEVWINETQRFEGVPAAAWAWTVGGYQVLHKYLKDRKGRVLSEAEISHWCKVVGIALKTLELMRRIDAVALPNGMFGKQEVRP